MDPADALGRLRELPPSSGASRALSVGPWLIRFEGLGDATASSLDRRWGPFVSGRSDGTATLVVSLLDSGDTVWLDRWERGERYRLEGTTVVGTPLVMSYHFALARDGPRAWRAAVARGGDEPEERLLDNVSRILVARLAAESGGIALHGAGVLREGRAWIFAGPSRSGKSTAVSHSPGCASLGDDFAAAIPATAGWVAVAVPFDNREAVPDGAPRGAFPLAGIWRLRQSVEDRIERPPLPASTASLLACAAFPWALPDLTPSATAAAARLTSDGLFGHLHLTESPAFWRLLE